MSGRNHLTAHWALVLVLVVAGLLTLPTLLTAQVCERHIKADVVALDQVFFWNRLGACQPQGQIFALKRDVVDVDTGKPCTDVACKPGNVMLREDKRPRPLTLRMNAGDCLSISFTNLINPDRDAVRQCPDCVKAPGVPANADEQVATRDLGIHVIGLQLVETILDDGTWVGTNPAGAVVPPGGHAVYNLYAEREGQHVLYGHGATTGGEGDGGQITAGLFGAVNVQPRGARWYRSQVTAEDMKLATVKHTPVGHPILDYEAVYPTGHPRAGRPILNMLQGHEIVHTDLTAIIAGPFAEKYPPNPVYPNRNRSFREFTIIYHDEIGAIQAFPKFFEDPVLNHTTHSVRDAFAINYGTGGIGAEIIANRLDVGPMRDCVGCKYEEFFLSSWTVGDPAQVVDVPANACVGDPTCRATEVLYPDDPSNVYHGYLRDHVKFRILHGGVKEHHIHHQHTHQWLFAPDSDESAYLDSQAIGPGSSFTLEMTYNGSGNRNAAVGDSIFHCHFYPHFAQGMWALWRVHDVFENGTRLLPDGEIAQGTPIPGLVPIAGQPMAPMPGAKVTIAPDPRLPHRGGQVQINGKFVRDMTATDIADVGNPGYPFWVPGNAGSRAPHPPLDTLDTGGLDRHVLLEGEALHVETRLDFTKEIEAVEAIPLAEKGEPVEEVAMRFHEKRFHDTFLTDGTPVTGNAGFVANGLPRQPGAPFAEPCMVEDRRTREAILRTDSPRTYKAADIQLDVAFNKAGWHFPQQRIITLWGDVKSTFAGERPPEPLFFRANSNDCISYYLTNLVPNIYELDDFQVRTPTDILGQHIHLVKFDVTSSDGAGNGWNYEDGTFSPDEVRERIRAIRRHNACFGNEWQGGDPRDGTFECPVLEPHPFFGAGPETPRTPGGAYLGAQTTVQRWYADDVLNLQGEDRTLRTVFTHDHFGPSTHQQAGLYAGLVVEPDNSKWRHPETGVIFGDRFDGGPTSWRADILTENSDDSYREFMLEYADFQLAYEKGSHPGLPFAGGPTFPNEWACHGLSPGDFCAGQQPGNGGGAGVAGLGFDNRKASINPPAKKEVGLPLLLQKAPLCPGGVEPPCPEAVSADEPGTFVVNYRNEPVAMRVRDPSEANCLVPALPGQNGCQAAGQAGDLAFAFSSRVKRADPRFNVQPLFYTPLTGNVEDTDPFTPLMQAFEHDRVQIRTLVGAHEEGHNFSVNGLKWLFEPSWMNSGYRNSQMAGISEHFEFEVPQVVKNPLLNRTDYLYAAGSSTDDLWNGNWGIFRVFDSSNLKLLRLPNNPNGGISVDAEERSKFDVVCPNTAPVREFAISAVLARDVLPNKTLIYNPRKVNGGPLHDPTAILYVRTSDLDPDTGRLKKGVPVEPLVLRARAGECINLKLHNQLPEKMPDLAGFNTLPMIVENFNNNEIRPSNHVGLHGQLVFFDVSRHDGNNVGVNQIRTAAPGKTTAYQWYAGDIFVQPTGTVKVTPIEFGATNLIPADRIKQPGKGAIGGLVIEPQTAVWSEDSNLALCGQDGQPRCSRASATVKVEKTGEYYREFALLFQDDVNLRFGSDTTLPTAAHEDGTGGTTATFLAGEAVPNTAEAEDPEDSGQKAFNYGTEPMWFRFGFAPDAPLGFTRDLVLTKILLNDLVGGDPETPVYQADRGDPVRFRVLEPGGHARNHIFQVHGHVWQQEPYVCPGQFHNSVPGECNPVDIPPQELGNNLLSLWEGARMGHGPTNHFDALLQNGAGGAFGIPGDYLYRDQSSFQFDGGLWGLMRVMP